MVHKLITSLALALLAVSARAQEVAAPLIIVTPARGDTAIHVGAIGLIGGALASGWFNSRVAGEVRDFQHSTGATNWDDLAMSVFSCIGTPAGTPCRDAFKFDGDQDAAVAKARSSGATHVVVVSLFQQFNGIRYRARATLRDIELGGKGPQVQRTLTAFYNSDAPESVMRAAKGDADQIREYWMSGSRSMLDQQARASLRQLRDMLDTLYTADHNDGNEPDGWKNMKPIREFESSGRAKCRGLPCMSTKVFSDHDGYLWLGTGRRSGDYGWTLVCLDQNAALHNANDVIQTLPALMKD
jgi:hypothetical protein